MEHYPTATQVDVDIPERPRAYLVQAHASLHAPAGAVMLAASAVDAMLKALNLVQGTLYARIERAAADHLITEAMKEWAHAVRLDANEQRHADETAAMPTEAEARRVVEFAEALGMFLFTLPARVQRGKAAAENLI